MNVKTIIPLVGIIAALAAFQPRALAWGSAGHMLIAAEAFRELSPEMQADALEVLKAHPEYEPWKKAYHPNPNVDLAAYLFMRCSTWPDEIRGSGGIYDHPEWHFIDYPLRPPAFPFEPDARPTNNVVYGVSQCEQALSDPKAGAELRAAYLSYLIHLVGDMHQPLHCESFYSDAYPKGDRGGNDFFVKPAQFGVRLHGIWDGLLGTSMDSQVQWKYAIQLEAQYPRSSLPELAGLTDPKAWSLEGRELAINYGYLHGQLKGAANADDAPSLPDGYLKAAKSVAERQGALAGYRLADEIQKYLKLDVAAVLPPEFTNLAAQVIHTNTITPAEAGQYIDETMTVHGNVVAVTVRPSITILEFGQPYPNTPFTAVVFAENAGPFGDLTKLKGQAAEVNGTITDYHNKPEMILESTNQLKIIATP